MDTPIIDPALMRDNLKYPFRVIEAGHRNDQVLFQLANETVQMRRVIACYNLMSCWPLIAHQLPLVMSDLDLEFASLGGQAMATRLTRHYNRLLDAYPPDVKHVEVLLPSLQMVYNLFNTFGYRYCGSHVQTIDILKIRDVCEYPPLKEVLDEPIPEGISITEVEAKYAEQASRIIEIITGPNIPHNALSEMVHAGSARATSIPPLLNGFGTRSDPSGRVMQHHVEAGAVQGWRNAADMAVASLSTRQVHLITLNLIPKSQYFFRRIRICAAGLSTLHQGDCGRRVPTTVHVPHNGFKGFVGSCFYDGPNLVWITKDNAHQFAGQDIPLVTSVGCQYTDGCCEHHYGWGNGRASKYLAPECHIGVEAACRIAGSNTQSAMGTKHNSGTNAEEFAIADAAMRHFVVGPNTIMLSGRYSSLLKDAYLRVPLSSLSSLTNLRFGVEDVPERFSTIEDIELGIEGGDKFRVDLTSNDACPFLSSEFIIYMVQHPKLWTHDDNYLTVRLSKWNCAQPMFAYNVISSDISRLIGQVDHFFKSTIRNYTSFSAAFNDLGKLLLTRTNARVVFIVQLLRAFLVRDDPNDPRIPVVVDPDNVRFKTVGDVIPHRSDTLLLAYERAHKSLLDPAAFITPKPKTPMDIMFGLGPYSDLGKPTLVQ